MEIIINEIKYQIDDNYYEAYVMANNYKGDVIIPPYVQYNGMLWIAVKGIAYSAFKGCTELTSIVLPDGLRTIDSYAFHGCTRLKELVIPDTVVDIHNNAFTRCRSLEKIKLPAMLRHLDYDLFWECVSLQEILIPPHVETIQSNCFYKCEQLKHINLPNGLKEIGRCCFTFCKSLTEICIPDSVTHMGDRVFEFCENLQRVVLPKELDYIPDSSFFCCEKLTDIVIPPTVDWIGEFAFRCSGLEKKEGMQHLGNILCGGKISEDANGVLRVEEGIRSIANRAFADNEELIEVILPDSLETIGEEAFTGCKNLKRVQLGQGLESIGTNAFAHCSALEKIYIPSRVTTIGAGAFAYCTSMREMVVDENNPKYDSRNQCNAIVQTERNMLVAGCATSVILDVLEIIGDNAFQGVYQSSELVLPKSMKCIGNGAFYENKSLQRVVINLEMEMIGGFAFQNCEALIDIELPKKYVEIGEDAFYGTACAHNQEPGAVYVGNHLCNYIPHTEKGPEPDCVIPEGIEYIDMCAFHFAPSMRIFFPKSLKGVDIAAFIPSEGDHELIAPEGMGNNYPVKNGRIKYKYRQNDFWWDLLNDEG